MNRFLNNEIESRTLEGALKVAKALIEEGYQIFIQQDEKVYVVSYEFNNEEYGTPKFASLTDEEITQLERAREKSLK
jgi:hypothetical protein